MGEEISGKSFTIEDENIFLEHLYRETKLLQSWFENNAFDDDDHLTLGLEIEAWLIDENQSPKPSNEDFLKIAQDKNLVHELSQYNFEINTEPENLTTNCFQQIEKKLLITWEKCQKVAKGINSRPLLIGMLPTLQKQMLQLHFISNSNRYKALNDRVFELRDGMPINIDIKGTDHLQITLDNLMLEAAATSIQVHLKTTQNNFKHLYNASQIISAPLVALAANSPYLYGHDLWDDTRIPVFEQSVNCQNYATAKQKSYKRASFGSGFLSDSPFDLFFENLQDYSLLLPYLSSSSKTEELNHLRLHNGTIWRWNRPIIGFNPGGKPHLRIEQRVMSSGPTPKDIVANMAFYTGLAYELSTSEFVKNEQFNFTDCYNNFYSCAKNGLRAQIKWLGKNIPVQQLISDHLIPLAKTGLKKLDVCDADIIMYIDEIIKPRTANGQNGCKWQRDFAKINGRDYITLSQEYWKNQVNNTPVHEWKI